MVEIVRQIERAWELLADIELRAGDIGWDYETHGPSIKRSKKGTKSRPDPYRAMPTGLGVACEELRFYLPVAHVGEVNISVQDLSFWLGALLSLRTERRIWAHNLGFELQVSKNIQQHIGSSEKLYCSQVAAWLAGWGTHKKLALKTVAKDLGLPTVGTHDDVLKKAGKDDNRHVPAEILGEYCAHDAWLAIEVGHRAYTRIEEHELAKHYHEVDMPMVEILRGIEEWGTPVDKARLQELAARITKERDDIAAEFKWLTTILLKMPTKCKVESGEFYKNGKPKTKTVEVEVEVEAGCDVGNDHQLSRWLYDEMQLWPTHGLERNGVGNWPTDKETLRNWTILPDPRWEAVEAYTLDQCRELGKDEFDIDWSEVKKIHEHALERVALARKLAQLRLDYSFRAKLVSTYLQPMMELPDCYGDGLLHTQYNLTGTATQRLSSSNPNLQNVPSRTPEGKAIRTALRARPGWKFVIFDYSQIELRVMAHLSQDPELVACYVFDEDVHAGTLEAMQKLWPGAQRGDAKITNFSTIYRISPPSLAKKMRVQVDQAEASIEAFYARFPRISDYHGKAIAYVEKRGYARTVDGFKAFLDNTKKRRNRWAKKAEMAWDVQNAAINYPIQGTAGGIAKLAMIGMWREWTARGVYGSEVMLAGQEHDCIMCEARDEFAQIAYDDMQRIMENVVQLRVPLTAVGGIGESWADAK